MSTLEMQKELAEYFKTQPVLKAWLFGSYARGEETPESDVDVLVTLDYSQKVGLLKFASMYLDLKNYLTRKWIWLRKEHCAHTLQLLPTKTKN